MNRELLLKKTREQLEKLPDHRLEEASDFIEFLINRIDDSLLVEGIKQISSKSASFSFFEEEEVLYKISDLRERYK